MEIIVGFEKETTMLKFKFDYLYQTLAYQTEAKDENV